MRTPKVPPRTRVLTTYKELQFHLREFMKGTFNFLWLYGPPGVGKTQAIKAAMRGHKVCYLKGRKSPAAFYDDCYRYRDQPFILDDLERLLEEENGATLVSALGETGPSKFLSWDTRTGRHSGDVPNHFYTSSRLCILTNKANHHEAIRSRAKTIYFQPTNEEIHRAAARFFWDQEIHDFIGRYVHQLPALDFRLYVHVYEDKIAGLDWRSLLLTEFAPERRTVITIQELESDPRFPTRRDKVRQAKKLLGIARPTYFRLLKELRQQGRLQPEGVAPIPLQKTRPRRTLSRAELDAEETSLRTPTDDQPTTPLDLPSDDFARPIRGQATTGPRPSVAADDMLGPGYEPPDDEEEDEDEEED